MKCADHMSSFYNRNIKSQPKSKGLTREFNES